MRELIGFEVECVREGDPRTPASVQLIEDFMTCDMRERATDEYGVTDPFPTRQFHIGDGAALELAVS